MEATSGSTDEAGNGCARKIALPTQRVAIEQQQELILAVIALHALRERRGVTQTALAEALNVSRPRVSRIENDGEDLRISTMERYVQALGGHLKVMEGDITREKCGTRAATLNLRTCS